MLSSEGNENGKKTTISLISKKTTLHVQHNFLYNSLPLFCMTTAWNFQKLPSYTFYGGNVVPVHVHFFFTAATKFSCCCSNKWLLISRSSSLSLFFSLSFPGLSPTSLRSCPLLIIPLCLSREEGMIHFFIGSHVKKPESGLFSDWTGNNTDDLRCSDWPNCRHPLVVVDFSLLFCLRIEQWIHTRVRF